ncbi:MAG TPA: TIGR02300 family protein [Micropepsaceae bacterium]|nr:TIGR02300 family protein [Micropepsaceae bacterium]
MAQIDLGLKRQCPSCGARFYDLAKRPIVCPKCSFKFEPEALLKPRKARVAEKPRAEAAPVVVEDTENEDLENENEDAETEEEAEEADVEAIDLSKPKVDDEAIEDEAEEGVAPEEKKPAKGRRGTTEEVDPDLEEYDDSEIEGGDDEEDDDTLVPVEDDDDDLSDIEVDDKPDPERE